MKKIVLMVLCCMSSLAIGTGRAWSAELTQEKTGLNSQRGGLNENIIKNLFQSRLSDDGTHYLLDSIEWQEGIFTEKGAREAVVSFYDSNQCHASNGGELWLLRYGHDWNMIKKIYEADGVFFETVDVDEDGILEIMVYSNSGGQGYDFSKYELVSLKHGSRSTLYLSEGFDNTGAQEEGEALCTHSIDFKDIDNDGILELIDKVERTQFKWSGKKFESEYIKTSSSVEQIVYKLQHGTFVKTNMKL